MQQDCGNCCQAVPRKDRKLGRIAAGMNLSACFNRNEKIAARRDKADIIQITGGEHFAVELSFGIGCRCGFGSRTDGNDSSVTGKCIHNFAAAANGGYAVKLCRFLPKRITSGTEQSAFFCQSDGKGRRGGNCLDIAPIIAISLSVIVTDI